MSEEKPVNELLKQLQPIVEKLNMLLKSDNFNYQRIIWDIEAKENKKVKLAEDIKALETQIGAEKQKAEAIVSVAKEEADRIIAIAREKNMEAEKRIQESKHILEDAMEKKHSKEKVKV